ncbi:low density lipoprotein receptor adapter protein 1 [Trichonephila inaurata madagascariensis]|uniref:Low density lipoprotein receptor adapter protein 1 n=1 Tax=Trichonephila inaurata madagascariensis TaxID=2747483 RepID=A0A8X7BZF4_9ARAC|nr:low density lipoprotein receptor adapter protein 1 [Trichonephila inaurata madagascariensis]
MASILKAVRVGSSGLFGRLKHKKLPEEWDDSIKEPVLDGITFYVKYLGSTLVDEPNDQQTTADAIKAVITMGFSPGGLSTGEKHLDFSIYRISFCSADASYDRVVAFIGTNKNETLECHAFLCSKRKVAQAAALTISQAFNIAFELWERAKEEKSSQNGKECINLEIADNIAVSECNSNKRNSCTDEQGTLIDLSMDGHSASETMKKLGFENDQNLNDSFSRLAHSRTHPMFGLGFNTEDLEDIQQFVHNQRKINEKDCFLDDQVDELLSL